MNKQSNKDFQLSNSDSFVTTELKKELGPMGPVMVPVQNVSIGYLKIEDVFIKLIAPSYVVLKNLEIPKSEFQNIWNEAEKICDFINEKRKELIKENNNPDSFILKK